MTKIEDNLANCEASLICHLQMTFQRRFVSKIIPLLLLWLSVMLLGGCTPEYNWRETTVADGRGIIMFPSRIQTEQRPIQVEGISSTFSMTSSAVEQAVFSVGFMPIPEAISQEKSKALVNKFVSALAVRAGKLAPESAQAGEIFTLETSVANQSSLMMARVVVHRGMLIQVVVSGPKQSLSKENALEFVRSLRLK